jgi:hypothetical protein
MIDVSSLTVESRRRLERLILRIVRLSGGAAGKAEQVSHVQGESHSDRGAENR